MKKILGLTISCLVTTLIANSASAASLLWTIDNPLVLNTGATVTGSFQYDVDTGDYTNIQLVASATTSSADGLYDVFAIGDSNELGAMMNEVAGSLLGQTVLKLTAATGDFTSPGTVDLFDVGIATCSDSTCGGLTWTADQASIINGPIGTLTASTVPLPAAGWFFGSGLLGLIGIARRKKA